jgi:hypothetical protein
MKKIVGILLALSATAAAADRPAPLTTGKPAAAPANKLLATLNPLSQKLVEKVKLDALSELDVAEVVAVRDSVRAPSPMAIAYAGAIEKVLVENPLSIPRERSERILLELALDLSEFGGAQSELFETLFAPAMDAMERAKEPKARPELSAQLAEIGAWAARTVTRLAGELKGEDAARARVRLAMERGRWGEAAQIAEKQLKVSKDPRWQAWLGAALTLAGRDREAAPYVAAAEHAGGEAQRQVQLAHVRRVSALAVDRAAKALKATGVSGLSVAAGGRLRAVDGACRKLFETPPAKSDLVSEAALACATVLWERPERAWLPTAASLVPDGAPGAPVRAAAALIRLLPEGKRPDEAARKAALADYQAALKDASLGPDAQPQDRAVLTLLGFLGASDKPASWSASGAEEKALLEEAGKQAPCDSRVFAMRAVAARPDRPKLGALVEEVIRGCVDKPEGAAATLNAIELYLQLHSEDPSPAAADLEPEIVKFAKAHDDDPEAVGAHADAVALKALRNGKSGTVIADEAALSRYETAIARWSPSAGASLRQRLEANAGYLSLAIARLLGEKQADLEAKFYIRAAGHIRQALALGEIPSITAIRAMYDIDTGTGMTDTTIDFEHLPSSRARNRAACMFATEASNRGDAVVTKQLLAIARAKPKNEEHKLVVPELIVETNASLSVRVEAEVLRPFVDLKTSVYLAPACDPDKIKVPPEVKAAPPATKK